MGEGILCLNSQRPTAIRSFDQVGINRFDPETQWEMRLQDRTLLLDPQYRYVLTQPQPHDGVDEVHYLTNAIFPWRVTKYSAVCYL